MKIEWEYTSGAFISNCRKFEIYADPKKEDWYHLTVDGKWNHCHKEIRFLKKIAQVIKDHKT